ncbi:PepSY domain-containing protein [Nannocystis bainbridge]|uniref:PepSY domain-containing protein n=1 Tax=Nannocystis bainbridge TaxID=2995303 RepID=A0ABT5E8R0_9BACT|nr:PepSY domain-containing protein [Nannocystis bainbridge]MDC0722246.1 PepSY domain-containing protein [Nannocystis bainbridge]
MHFLLMSLLLSLAPACSHAATSATPTASTAPAATAPREATTPKISLEAAQATALKRVPGTVIDAELERERGRWIYSIEIQPDDRSQPRKEVEVDGETGAIVHVEDEHDD